MCSSQVMRAGAWAGRDGHVMEGSGKPLHPAKPQKVKIGIGRRRPARRSVSYASGARRRKISQDDERAMCVRDRAARTFVRPTDTSIQQTGLAGFVRNGSGSVADGHRSPMSNLVHSYIRSSS